MTQQFDDLNDHLSRGFIPKINQFPPNFIAANNAARAFQAWTALAEFLMDSGEWIKVLDLVDNAPAILFGHPEVARVRELALGATRHARSFEDFKALYSTYAEEHGGPLQDSGIKFLDRYHCVLGMFHEPKSVLGIGCGDGVFDNEVLDHHPQIKRYVIADASRAQAVVQKLNELHEAEVILHDVKDGLYDWPLESFDAVIALELIEHVPDQDLFLKEAWSRVAPGGSLHLSTPDARIWVCPHDCTGQMMHHITASTPTTLLKMIRGLPDASNCQMMTSEEGHSIVRVDRKAA